MHAPPAGLQWVPGRASTCTQRALILDAIPLFCMGSAWLARRVINSIQTSDLRNLFNPENVYISKEGGGAGNNWASGFAQGEAVQEMLLDMMGEKHVHECMVRINCASMVTERASVLTPAITVSACRPWLHTVQYCTRWPRGGVVRHVVAWFCVRVTPAPGASSCLCPLRGACELHNMHSTTSGALHHHWAGLCMLPCHRHD